MTWWIRTQHPFWAIAVTVIGTVGVLVLPESAALPIPTLSGSAAFAAVRPFALYAMIVTLTLWAGFAQAHTSAILAGTRPVKIYVLVTVCIAWGASAAIAVLYALLTGSMGAPSLLLLRDVLGLFGLGLLLTPFAGYRYSGAVVTVYVFAAAIFGRTTGDGERDAALWAWPISESVSADYGIPAAALFIAGAVVWLLHRRGRYSARLVAQAMDTRRE